MKQCVTHSDRGDVSACAVQTNSHYRPPTNKTTASARMACHTIVEGNLCLLLLPVACCSSCSTRSRESTEVLSSGTAPGLQLFSYGMHATKGRRVCRHRRGRLAKGERVQGFASIHLRQINAHDRKVDSTSKRQQDMQGASHLPLPCHMHKRSDQTYAKE